MDTSPNGLLLPTPSHHSQLLKAGVSGTVRPSIFRSVLKKTCCWLAGGRGIQPKAAQKVGLFHAEGTVQTSVLSSALSQPVTWSMGSDAKVLPSAPLGHPLVFNWSGSERGRDPPDSARNLSSSPVTAPSLLLCGGGNSASPVAPSTYPLDLLLLQPGEPFLGSRAGSVPGSVAGGGSYIWLDQLTWRHQPALGLVHPPPTSVPTFPFTLPIQVEAPHLPPS